MCWVSLGSVAVTVRSSPFGKEAAFVFHPDDRSLPAPRRDGCVDKIRLTLAPLPGLKTGNGSGMPISPVYYKAPALSLANATLAS